jgi:tRNA-specific 2-thiouridylase
MKHTTAVAISGGVDSLMSAYLLKEQGHDLIGIHFLTGYESEKLNISEIAAQVDIPYEIIDIKADFDREVVDYFSKTYLAGKTPNPCLVCNPRIKFGIIFEKARRFGINRIATGHYAGIQKDSSGGRHLVRGADRYKDQSYFLSFLTRKQLSRACFPLWNLTKNNVVKKAAALGLQPVTRSESQDVCFIQGLTYGQFLQQRLGFTPEPGEIVDENGNVLGMHPGLHLFTVGQRRGINCPADVPYYVLRLDVERNRLVVGPKASTLSSKCRVEKINWIQPQPSKELRVKTRVRYRHQAAPATLQPERDGFATIVFDRPQSAVTPGQGAVFYINDEVIGGGMIV